jgi:hypothetical protein
MESFFIRLYLLIHIHAARKHLFQNVDVTPQSCETCRAPAKLTLMQVPEQSASFADLRHPVALKLTDAYSTIYKVYKVEVIKNATVYFKFHPLDSINFGQDT